MTPKQEQFVAEYLANGLNATKAAISAGYSEKSAASIGEENLRKPEISSAIAAKRGQKLEKLDVTIERTLQEIARIAYFNPKKLFEDDGSLKRINDIDDDTAAAIGGLEVQELFEGDGDQKHAYGLLKKVKLIDKNSSLDKLMRYLGQYKDKLEHSGEVKISRVVIPNRIATQASQCDIQPEFG